MLRRGLRVSCTTSERATCQVTLVIARKSAGRVRLKLRKGAKELQLGRSKSVAATERQGGDADRAPGAEVPREARPPDRALGRTARPRDRA